jgi:predicted cobalt transporter CbtA
VDRVWWFNIVDAGSIGGNIIWFSVHLRADVLGLVCVICVRPVRTFAG